MLLIFIWILILYLIWVLKVKWLILKKLIHFLLHICQIIIVCKQLTPQRLSTSMFNIDSGNAILIIFKKIILSLLWLLRVSGIIHFIWSIIIWHRIDRAMILKIKNTALSFLINILPFGYIIWSLLFIFLRLRSAHLSYFIEYREIHLSQILAPDLCSSFHQLSPVKF